MKFSIKDFFSNCDEIQFSANLVTFAKEFINGKLHFLCSVQDYLEVNIHLRRNIFAPVHLSLHKFSIKDFISKCDQIRSFLQIWSHLLRTSLMENFIF